MFVCICMYVYVCMPVKEVCMWHAWVRKRKKYDRFGRDATWCQFNGINGDLSGIVNLYAESEL